MEEAVEVVPLSEDGEAVMRMLRWMGGEWRPDQIPAFLIVREVGNVDVIIEAAGGHLGVL